jgi:hypothetical protein
MRFKTYATAGVFLILVSGCGNGEESAQSTPDVPPPSASFEITEENAFEVVNLAAMTNPNIKYLLEKLVVDIGNSTADSEIMFIPDNLSAPASQPESRQSTTSREKLCEAGGKILIETFDTHTSIHFNNCTKTLLNEYDDLSYTSTEIMNGHFRIDDDRTILNYPDAKLITYDIQERAVSELGSEFNVAVKGSYSSGVNRESYIIRNFNAQSRHWGWTMDGVKHDYVANAENFNSTTFITAPVDEYGTLPLEFNGFVFTSGSEPDGLIPMLNGTVYIEGQIKDTNEVIYKVKGAKSSTLDTSIDTTGMTLSLNSAESLFFPWLEETTKMESLTQLGHQKSNFQIAGKRIVFYSDKSAIGVSR